MGVYAETSGAEIICKDKKTALIVEKILKKQNKKSDDNGNDFARNVEADREFVYFDASSGRVQNLEWQLQQIWEAIKDIKGVIELTSSFLVEGDGMSFSNEE